MFTPDFQSFWDRGFNRLLPIIPPGAPIFEKSSIAARIAVGDDARGKVPGIKRQDGTWQGIALVKIESTEADTRRWAEMGAGTGIKTGEGLIAVDIDTTDEPAAQRITQLAHDILGPALPRVGRAPKCLLLYEAPPETAYKQVRFSTATEGDARTEILSEGRQFVGHGLHPSTGEPYRWPEGVPRRADLTPVTADQLTSFLAAVANQFEGRVVDRSNEAETPDQEELRAPDWSALEQTVNAVPNTSAMFPSRDDYVRMAYAVRAAAPDGYEHNARDLYLDWCARWEDGENDPERAVRDWQRAKPPFRVGYSFLTSHAPHLFFDNLGGDTDTALSEREKVEEIFEQHKEATRRPPFQLLTIDDVFDLPPPKFLVDRHIPQDGFGLLYGPPGSKKSFLALDMALHLAYGLDTWHGDPIERGTRTGALYIAGEGAHGFSNRIRAWQHDRLLPTGTAPDFHFLFQPCNFMNHEDVQRLIESVKTTHPSDLALVVVDTVSRAIPGADENLQKDMTTFVSACDAIRHHTGAFVLGVHHTSKAGDMRGSSVFMGQADAVFSINTKPKSPVTYLNCDKQKDAPDGWHDAYRMAEVDLGERGTSLCPSRVEPGTEVSEGRLDAETAKAMLGRLEEAWEAGAPLSGRYQSKDRYAPRILSSEFQIAASEIEDVLAMWEKVGQLVVEPAGRGGRKSGYRVARDGGSDVAEGGIFG